MVSEEFGAAMDLKTKMLERRSKRVRPHLDDKVLASWNGLMLGAMARAYAVLDDARYRAAAENKSNIYLSPATSGEP